MTKKRYEIVFDGLACATKIIGIYAGRQAVELIIGVNLLYRYFLILLQYEGNIKFFIT
jgi:hypothetical protein